MNAYTICQNQSAKLDGKSTRERIQTEMKYTLWSLLVVKIPVWNVTKQLLAYTVNIFNDNLEENRIFPMAKRQLNYKKGILYIARPGWHMKVKQSSTVANDVKKRSKANSPIVLLRSRSIRILFLFRRQEKNTSFRSWCLNQTYSLDNNKPTLYACVHF